MTRETPARQDPRSSGDGKRLVLVVHGIGDEAAGSAVRAFASVVAETESDRSFVREVRWLLPGGSGRHLKHFPCHIEWWGTTSP